MELSIWWSPMEWREGTVVARWNEAALQAIRADKPVPTVITRALHVAHAAMYDVWAAFDREAEGAYFNPRRTLRMPGRRHREGFLESAISAAAHRLAFSVVRAARLAHAG